MVLLFIKVLINIFAILASIFLVYFIVENRKLRYILNSICFVVLSTGINQFIAFLTGLDRQFVSFVFTVPLILTISISILRKFGDMGQINKMSIFSFLTVLLFIFITPSVFVFFNGITNDAYIFWLKRVALVLVIITAGYMPFLYSSKSLLYTSLVVFIINALGVIGSIIFPEAYIIMMADSDEMIKNGLNPIGGGFLVNPNAAAQALIFSYLAIFIFKDISRFLISEFIALAMLLMLVVVMTGSRAGFGLAVLILFFQLFKIHKMRRINFTSLFGIILIVTVLFHYVISGDENVISIFNTSRLFDSSNQSNIESNDARYTALIDAIKLFADNPITGVGFYNRSKLLHTQPHNMYAAYIADIGVVGLIVILIFVIYNYFYFTNSVNKYFPKLAIFSMLLMGLFDHDLAYSMPFSFLMFTLVAASTTNRVRMHQHNYFEI